MWGGVRREKVRRGDEGGRFSTLPPFSLSDWGPGYHSILSDPVGEGKVMAVEDPIRSI